MKIINNGEIDGEPILRQQTAGELLASLLADQEKHKANPNCPYCEGKGYKFEPMGKDDYEKEICDCVTNTYK